MFVLRYSDITFCENYKKKKQHRSRATQSSRHLGGNNDAIVDFIQGKHSSIMTNPTKISSTILFKL